MNPDLAAKRLNALRPVYEALQRLRDDGSALHGGYAEGPIPEAGDPILGDIFLALLALEQADDLLRSCGDRLAEAAGLKRPH